MSEMIFPNSFVRQFSGPLDVDLVFSTTTTRTNYLTSARRYPGQIVSDLQDGKAYKLNVAGTSWEEFGSINEYQGTDLKALSSNWENTYNTVLANSATTWNYQGTDLKALSSNWENTYNTVLANSAGWEAAFGSAGADAAVRALTGNWENTYNTVQSNSANYILDGGNTKGSNLSIGTNNAFDLALETNNISRLIILSSGNIGVGTAAPSEQLFVAGNVKSTNLLIPGSVSVTPATVTVLPSGNDIIFANQIAPVIITSFSNGVAGITYTLTNKNTNSVTISASQTLYVRGGSGANWYSNMASYSLASIVLLSGHSCSLRADSNTVFSVW